MAEKKSLTLSEVLGTFADGVNKKAEEDAAPPEKNKDEKAKADVQAAESRVASAERELIDATTALRNIAVEAVDGHTEALAKEAMLFGNLFAASVTGRLRKEAGLSEGRMDNHVALLLKEAMDDAYQDMMLKLAEDDDGDPTEIAGEIADNAYEEALEELGDEDAAAEVAEAVYTAALGELAGDEDDGEEGDEEDDDDDDDED
jgi:hypothetical protein